MKKFTSLRGKLTSALAALLLLCATASAQIPEYYYFQMNEGAGTSTLDLAVPGLGGTATFNSGWATPGHLGFACLDGTAAPGAGSFLQTNVPNNISGDWTIEFWNFDLLGSTTTNYCMGDSTATGFRCFSGGVAGTGNLLLRGPVTDTLATGAAPINVWTHVAYVYDDTALTITPYVNGVAGTPVAQTTNITISGTAATGLNIGGYTANYTGRVDEYRFWSQARSAADINNFMNVELGASGFADDLGCLSVDSPSNASSCSALSNAESVSFTTVNFGTNTINIGASFTADLIVNGTNLATENFTFLSSNHATYGTEQFTFATTVDMSAGGTQNIDVTLTYAGDMDNSNDTGSLSVDAGSLTDLATSSVDSPLDAVGCNILSNAESVSFTVTNLGANSILLGSAFSATLIHNGTALATENFTVLAADILCGGTASFTFATTADLSAGGVQNIDVTVAYAGDVQPGNDTASRAVNASGPGGAFVNTFPYTEDFDTFGGAANGLTSPVNNGWQQDPNDSTGSNGDWYFGTGTSSTNSGPETNGLGDHTSGAGRFGFVEDSGSTNPIINLWSPCIDLTGTSNPAMRIWVNAHDYNGTNLYFNPVHIDLLTSGGVVTSAGSVTSDTGDQWVSVTISLVPYIGQVIQAQIRGTNAGSTSFYCDSSIDDFSVFEQTVLAGQAPQAGVATLDINGAVNANTNMVGSGDNGPYAASAPSGGQMNYTITGEAFGGILLVGGPLNVQVATYPGFGQFDIGTLPLNGAGIPGNLFVWADGITAPLVGLNQFFQLNAAGSTVVNIGLPSLPVGTLTTFQCINTHSVQIVGFSNAVEFSIM